MVCVVRVGQHTGNKFVDGWKPLDYFEPVCLVDGKAHLLRPCTNPFKTASNASPIITPQNKVKYTDGASKCSNKK